MSVYKDFEYKVIDGQVTLTEYVGEEEQPEIPTEIEGYPVTCIGEKAFSEHGFQITKIDIPETIKAIESSAFEMCLSLETMILHEGLEVVEDDFIWMTAVKQLVIPKSVHQLDRFLHTNLESLLIDEGNPYYKVSEGGFYQKKDGEKTLLSIVIAESQTSYIVEAGTTIIAKDAFAGQSQLKELYVPESVHTIETGALENQQRGFGKTGLQVVRIDAENKKYDADENGVYERLENGGVKLLQCLNSQDELDLNVWREKELTVIGERAFFKAVAKKIVIPASVKKVERQAFAECKNLEVIIFEADQTRLYIPKKPFDFQDAILKCIDNSQPQQTPQERYDSMFLQLKRLDEKVKMACCRLKYPGGLHQEARSTYEIYLQQNLMEAVADVADREDHQVLAALSELGFFTAANIEEVIDICSRRQKTGMVSFLLDYKAKHIGKDTFSFEL